MDVAGPAVVVEGLHVPVHGDDSTCDDGASDDDAFAGQPRHLPGQTQ